MREADAAQACTHLLGSGAPLESTRCHAISRSQRSTSARARAASRSRAKSSLRTQEHTKRCLRVTRTSGSESKLRSTRPVPAMGCTAAFQVYLNKCQAMLCCAGPPPASTSSCAQRKCPLRLLPSLTSRAPGSCTPRQGTPQSRRDTPQHEASSRAPQSTTARRGFLAAPAAR
jgi:hypothetical protein